jgi:hypothetical protein
MGFEINWPPEDMD